MPWSAVCSRTHSVTDTANGFHQLTLIAKLFPQATYVRVERSRGRVAMLAPDLIHQEFAGEHISTGSHQRMEEIELFSGQHDQLAADKPLPTLRQKADLPELQRFCSIVAHPAEDRTNPQHEFAWTEGFHD